VQHCIEAITSGYLSNNKWSISTTDPCFDANSNPSFPGGMADAEEESLRPDINWIRSLLPWPLRSAMRMA